MGEPVRLLIVRDHLVWSGGTTHFLDLLPRIDPKRIGFRFCVLAGPGDESASFAERGIAPMHLPRRWHDPFAVRRLLRLVRSERPDLLHLSGPRAMLAGRLVAGGAGVPVSIWFNNALPEPGWQRAAQRRLPRYTTAGIAVSRATADWASRTYRVPRETIEVQHSVPDLDPFLNADLEQRDRTREDLGIARDAQVIVLAGRLLDRQKGQFGMIRSMPGILENVPKAHLLIVGDGPDLTACESLVADLELAGRVTLAGRRHDMPEILAAADVAVVPSQVEEAFAYTAIEASAAGLPIVAFRVGGLPEAVRDGETGIVVGRNDWGAFADAVAACLTDMAMARRLGESGRTFAAGFTVEDAVERFTRFHEALAARDRERLSGGASP